MGYNNDQTNAIDQISYSVREKKICVNSIVFRGYLIIVFLEIIYWRGIVNNTLLTKNINTVLYLFKISVFYSIRYKYLVFCNDCYESICKTWDIFFIENRRQKRNNEYSKLSYQLEIHTFIVFVCQIDWVHANFPITNAKKKLRIIYAGNPRSCSNTRMRHRWNDTLKSKQYGTENGIFRHLCTIFFKKRICK